MILYILFQHKTQEISISSLRRQTEMEFSIPDEKRAGWQIRLYLSQHCTTNKICSNQYEKILFAKELALEHDLKR